MEYSKRFSGNDELRMRFTVWLKIVVKRVKIDYIRRQKKRYIEVSIEEAAIIAQKNEDKEKARKMLKNYVVGLVVIAVILVACPYLVNGIAALIAG